MDAATVSNTTKNWSAVNFVTVSLSTLKLHSLATKSSSKSITNRDGGESQTKMSDGGAGESSNSTSDDGDSTITPGGGYG